MLSPLTRYFKGLRAPLDGLGYLRQNKSLWAWVLPPALVNTLVTIGVLVGAVVLAWMLIAWAWPMYGDSLWQWVFKLAAAIGIVLGVIGLAVVLWLILISVCVGYLLGLLAERVEKKLGLDESQISPMSLVRETGEALIESGKILSIHGVAFLMQFIPVVGTVVSVPAALLADAYVLGGEVMGYPMGVRGMTLKERSVFIKAHRLETVGLGSAVLPTSFVPVLGGFVMCFATIGAVLLYRELSEARIQTKPSAASPGN